MVRETLKVSGRNYLGSKADKIIWKNIKVDPYLILYTKTYLNVLKN